MRDTSAEEVSTMWGKLGATAAFAFPAISLRVLGIDIPPPILASVVRWGSTESTARQAGAFD